MIGRLAYDAGLVEEVVLRAETRLPRSEADCFRAERDRIYPWEDPDEREARFEELHGRWFLRLRLDGPLHAALAEQPEILCRVSGCRVLRAVAKRDEGADLHDDLSARPVGSGASAPALILRLRPESLLEPDRLLSLLRRELQQVADMLDPAFGYERELSACALDPAAAGLLRERYRVLWDATVEGRLSRRYGLDPTAREARRSEFSRAFPALGKDADAAFAVWFKACRPSHAAILEFARAAGLIPGVLSRAIAAGGSSAATDSSDQAALPIPAPLLAPR